MDGYAIYTAMFNWPGFPAASVGHAWSDDLLDPRRDLSQGLRAARRHHAVRPLPGQRGRAG